MSVAASVLLPPLRDGDRLTSDEFMRRWEAMPDLKFAELIDGVVYMPSPVSNGHSDFHHPLTCWTGYYIAGTGPAVRGGIDATWLMGERDTTQPDIALRILPEYGGQSHLEGEYAGGAPELIIEVASSSRNRDLGPKLKLYERMGVREYIVVLAKKKQVSWKELIDGKFQAIEPSSDGIIRSRFFPGLWLDPAALWRIDLQRLSAVVQQGLATPEHAAFVARLARK
jgi:Uma2 family endonuclease